MPTTVAGGRIAAWPMYAVDPGAVRGFWRALRASLEAAGLAGVPATLSEPADLAAHWRDPSLLLSHTCGYPLATALRGSVRYVATPRFHAPGCAGARYSSAIMVRSAETAAGLVDLRGRRVAFNSRDSQSGYNALRASVAPHARAGRFFSDAIATGAHRRSLAAVRSGEADVAAIDAVTLALLGASHPAEVEGLRVLDYTAACPGLPFIASGAISDGDLAALRRALASVCAADEPAARPLLLDGIEVLPPDAYDVVLAMEADAVARGYPELR